MSKITLVLQRLALPTLFLLATCGGAQTGDMGTAEQLHARGDDAGAVAIYQRMTIKNPGDAAARLKIAAILEAHGNDQGAAEQYEAILKNDPDNGDVHRALGRLYIKAMQPEQAKAEYEKALAIDAHDAKARNGLGIALDMMGSHEAAQKMYRAVLEEDTADYSALNNLAHSYVLVGSYTQAIELLESHVKDKEATPALRQNLAEAYAMAGMDADAERVSLIDFTPLQTKRNIAFWHAERDRLGVAPKLYASLGVFATSGMAAARIDDIKAQLPADTAGLLMAVQPEVRSIGGTPHFTVEVTGFVHKPKLRAFCDRLKKNGFPCIPHGL